MISSVDRVLILITFCVCFAQLYGQTNNEINTKAIVAYESGHYRDAVQLWMELLAEGNSDPDIFFNIGNAESMLGNVAQAILYYEKALRIKPGDPDIRSAIANERNKIENGVSAIQKFFLAEWIRGFIALLRPGGWALFGIVLFLLGLVKWLHALALFEYGRFIKVGKIWHFVAAGFIFLIIATLSYKQIYSLHEGIIFSSCELRQGPSVQSPHIRTIHPGEKVRIEDEIRGWYKVNLLNLDEGWISEECVKIIDVRNSNERSVQSNNQ